MIPDIVKTFLLEQKEVKSCFCLAINQQLNIIQSFGSSNMIGVSKPRINQSIYEFFPILITETFDADFEIPFYNVTENHVCHIYFLKSKSISYLILVDKSEIFQVTQKYQQFAHDDNISKNKFKRLAKELEKAKQNLNKSNQEKAILIAMLSHELGTPLTSILGYSELLLKQSSGYNKGLEIIHRNATHLKHTIENTLLFGRSEAGGFQAQIESTPVKVFFNELITSLAPIAANKKLKLQANYPRNLILNIDITRTRQILINLLNNAIKYTETGSIELKFSMINDKYIFSVVDTGLGVAKELQETIFNPWERINENAEEGSGIGLYISQKLAQAIGGILKLKYSSKEFGSIFQLLIPVNSIETKTQKNKILTRLKKCQNKSLLVIDDDEDILALIEALLMPLELKVYTALNFPQAQQNLQNHEIDMVLTDYNLGPIKASSFIKTIKNSYHIPVLLMTAMPTDTYKSTYQSQGFNDVISKPLSSEDLLSAITNNL